MTNKEASMLQEQMIAKTLCWKPVVGSGATKFRKGDVISDRWLGECKTHTTPGHRIVFDLEVWSKIQDEATAHNRYPVLFVDDGSQKLSETWACFGASPFSDVEVVDAPQDIVYVSEAAIRFSSSTLWDNQLDLQQKSESVHVYRTNTRIGTLYVTPVLSFIRLLYED